MCSRLKTKWGSCNPRASTIRLNTEVAKKPKELPGIHRRPRDGALAGIPHNARFIALMDGFMPNWRLRRSHLESIACTA